MIDLDQKIVPVNLLTFDDANTALGSINVKMFAEVSRLTGFYNGLPVPHDDPAYIVVLARNWLDNNFPGWN